MLSPATTAPLVQHLPPAAKAGGFLLLLTAVASVHLLPLLWLIMADTPVTVQQPPVLVGVLIKPNAAQLSAQMQNLPQASPEQTIVDRAEPAEIVAKPLVKPVVAPVKLPVKPATKPSAKPLIKTALPVQPTTTAPADTARQIAAPVQYNDHAAAATPLSAPVLNASAQHNAPPVYPALSRRLREQGTVILSLTVLSTGMVADVVLEQSSGYARLDQAALAAVVHWRYQPAQRAGNAVDYRYRQRLEFSLTEGVKQ